MWRGRRRLAQRWKRPIQQPLIAASTADRAVIDSGGESAPVTRKR
jgi:hypothetical protein